MLVEQDALVKAAQELEALPSTVTRLSQILTSPDWDLKDVEEAVSLDLALAPRILRLANSALASRGHPISTVREAVMRVGTGPIFSMAMALGVQRRFKRPIVQYGIGEGELWVHSVAAALTVEIMSVQRKVKPPVESFTAALLHDVGKLVMARFLEPQYLRLLRAAESQGQMSARRAETEVLGVEHGELGALVAQHWKLPERLVRGIQYHHDPDTATDPIAHFVHVADAVACIVDARRSGRLPSPLETVVEASTREALKLDDAAIDQLADAVNERLGEVLERYT